MHHNDIYNNASLGDALFSGTPSGAGAITVSAGADNYVIEHNWIAGNLSSSDGGGIVHSGFTINGRISNNWVLFNQTVNPTLPTNGGGIGIIGSNSDRTLASTGLECGSTNDVDCIPGIGDGTGRGLVIDSNLIIGNSAESGSGGGLRLFMSVRCRRCARRPARTAALVLHAARLGAPGLEQPGGHGRRPGARTGAGVSALTSRMLPLWGSCREATEGASPFSLKPVRTTRMSRPTPPPPSPRRSCPRTSRARAFPVSPSIRTTGSFGVTSSKRARGPGQVTRRLTKRLTSPSCSIIKLMKTDTVLKLAVQKSFKSEQCHAV